MRARRDLESALRALGSRDTPVVSVSSVPPPSGIDDLVEALDAHRAAIDLPATRLRARRLTALADFLAERGEAGLRALGGRREAERFLDSLHPALDAAALVGALEERASEEGGG